MSKVFYRYVRPVLFNAKRAELVTQKKGGICLRFQEQAGELWFTSAMCDHTQLFSKDVAKCIADDRALFAITSGMAMAGYHGPICKVTKNSDELIDAVIKFCMNPQFESIDDLHRLSDVQEQYWLHEYKNVGTYLHVLSTSNKSQEEMLQHYKDAVSASNVTQSYSSFDPR